MMENLVDPFKVYVRVRPLLAHERNQVNAEIQKGKTIPEQIVTAESNTVYLTDPNNPELYGKNVKAFPFDRVFTEKDDNKTIFQTIIKKLVDNILQGYNSTALAYGVTGAGKTHTMFGDMYRNQADNKEKGICMYAVDYLFSKINKEKDKKMFTIKISYLEIYNEQVIDLLTSKPSSEGIMIVEDPNKGVLVPDLTEIVVKNSNQVLNYMLKGNNRRTKGPTGQNQFSSRSHAILEINIEQCGKNIEKGDILVSKMLLVDLAGTERGGKEKGIRREEGGNINKSLLALGNCINILSDKTKKGSFVPYRDSKLTRLLKDSLGGNTATIMIACVSPFPLTYEETHSTLKYASRANSIDKKITKNFKEIDQNTSQYREIISSLRNEITRLKEIIRAQHLKIKNKGMAGEEEIISNKNSKETASSKNEDGTYDEFFNSEDNDRSQSNDKNNNDDDSHGIIIHFSADIYDNILNKNLKDLSDVELEDLEKKLDNLYYDKIKLEEKIKQGVKDTEINEKYAQIKNFYQKFIDELNDKLVENTEENMMIKFNIKEVLESLQQSSENLRSVNELIKNESDKEELTRLTKEKKKIESTIQDANEEIEKQKVKLQKNTKTKSFLKKSLVKFISNTQIGECKEVQGMLTRLSNEKRELEIKTQKYQEYFNSVLKEKEKKTHEIFQLTNELEKTKLLLQVKDKNISELESKINEIQSQNSHLFNKPYQSPLTKSMLNFIDDCDSRSSSKEHQHKIHHRSTSIKNLSRYSNSTTTNNNNSSNNYISINLNSKIPTITAFIKGGDIYSHDASLESSISNLKYNLTVKPSSKSPAQKSANKSRKMHKITPSTSLAKKANGKKVNIKDSMSLANLRPKNKSNGVPSDITDDTTTINQNANVINNNSNTIANSSTNGINCGVKMQKVYHGYISPIKKISLEGEGNACTEPNVKKSQK